MPTEHDMSATHESRPAAPQTADGAGAQEVAADLSAPALPALLAHPEIGGRGNGPVRQAAILQLQQTQGNRATRRLLQRQVGVQRDGPDAGTTTAPAAPVAATPLKTIDDLILLVQRVESAYPGDDWKGITTRIRKAYYDGFLWNSMIKDRENYGGLGAPPLSAPDLQAFTDANQHPEITVNGKSIDIGHVFTGLDAMNFPKTGTIMSLGGVEGPPGATWGGDVGSALAEWDFRSGDRTKRIDYYNQFASNDDMLGDVDGIALSQPPPAAAAGKLSDRLTAYYKGTGGAAGGSSQRFTKFAQAAGFAWTGRGSGIRLDQAAKDHIRKQIDNFGVQWRRKSGGQSGANWFHDQDLDWFRDHFVDWVQQGLAAENP